METCKTCNKEFTKATLSKHDGSCGRCFKVASMAPTIDEVFVEDESSDEPKPIKRKKPINGALRSAVWRTYASAKTLEWTCLVCQGSISTETFHCGHVLAEALGGETKLENLRPICAHCNTSMGTSHMMDFVEKHGFINADQGLKNYPKVDQKWLRVNVLVALNNWLAERNHGWTAAFRRLTLAQPQQSDDNYRLWLSYLAYCWVFFEQYSVLLPTHVAVYLRIIHDLVGSDASPRRFFITVDQHLNHFRQFSELQDLARARLLQLE